MNLLPCCIRIKNIQKVCGIQKTLDNRTWLRLSSRTAAQRARRRRGQIYARYGEGTIPDPGGRGPKGGGRIWGSGGNKQRNARLPFTQSSVPQSSQPSQAGFLAILGRGVSTSVDNPFPILTTTSMIPLPTPGVGLICSNPQLTTIITVISPCGRKPSHSVFSLEVMLASHDGRYVNPFPLPLPWGFFFARKLEIKLWKKSQNVINCSHGIEKPHPKCDLPVCVCVQPSSFPKMGSE